MDELTQLEKLLDNFRIVAQDGITVHGSLRTGYAVNTPPISGAGASGFPGGIIPPVTTGACCHINGSCAIEIEDDCIDGGGAYQGDGTTCDDVNCTHTGACCAEDGTCSIMTQADCTGTYQGDGTTCDPNPCPLPGNGACCIPIVCGDGTCGSNCSILTSSDCGIAGGDYQGDGTTCSGDPCGIPGVCLDGTCCEPGSVDLCLGFCCHQPCCSDGICCDTTDPEAVCCPNNLAVSSCCLHTQICCHGSGVNCCCDPGTTCCPNTDFGCSCCGPGTTCHGDIGCF